MPERTKKKGKRRGVPQTEEEERAGAGQEQFQPADLSNQFADPMDLLGSMFQPSQGGGTAPSGAIPLAAAGGALGGGGRGGNDQTQMLQALRDLYQEQLPFAREQLAKQPTVKEAYAAKAEAADPVAWAAKQHEARLARDPWGPGGLFEGRGASQMSPEAVLASQGNNAMNQWAQRGAVEGIDPKELEKFNEQVRLSRRSYT